MWPQTQRWHADQRKMCKNTLWLLVWLFNKCSPVSTSTTWFLVCYNSCTFTEAFCNLCKLCCGGFFNSSINLWLLKNYFDMLMHTVNTSLPLLPLHQWLYLRSPLCETTEVRRRQHSHWTHPRWRWVCKQRRSGAVSPLVQPETPGVEPTWNCGDDSRLQE